MARERYRGMSEPQLEDMIRGLPRREPPARLRARVLAQAIARRAPRLAWAFAALALLLLADGAVIRWQNSGGPSSPPRLSVVSQQQEKQDKDLLSLAQQTYGGRAWQFARSGRASHADSYLQYRNRLLNATDRG